MKKILWLLFLGAVVGFCIWGKSYIDDKTVDYKTVVDESLTKYYLSGNVKDLDELVTLLGDHKDDDKIRIGIQSRSFEIISNWYTYLDNKYVCNITNKNSCENQHDEFVALNLKLKNLFSKKANGTTLILSSSYTNLITEGEKKVLALEKVISNPAASYPDDSEKVREKKCQNVLECSSCRDGLCSCIYMGTDKYKEAIVCKDTSNKS